MSVIDRRKFLKLIGSGISGIALGGCGEFINPSSDKRQKPNIVLIIADDIGYECLSCYGSISYRTPNLDRLAEEGMRFTHCYSQPLCTPSRVQIMTGKYNFRNYIEFGVMNPKEMTFGHIMKKAGYVTCVAGKWQLYGSTKQPGEARGTGILPKQAGFDEYCLWQIAGKGSRYSDPFIYYNSEKSKVFKGRYGPDIFCDYINGFITRHRDEPFFVYYPMCLSHSPFEPTPDSNDWSKPGGKANPKYFADMVAYMDKIVGRIVDKLDELNLRRNTLILFTGDNGTDRNISSKMQDGRIIKGGKGRTTDGGTRVPLIVNWKGTTPAGKVCDDLIDFTDFVPTLAQAGKAQIPKEMVVDGRSFLPQLCGEKGSPREWIFCYYDARHPSIEFKPRRFVRDKRWKLYGDGRLFDISADVLEKNPIAEGLGGKEAAKAQKKLQKVLDLMKLKGGYCQQ